MLNAFKQFFERAVIGNSVASLTKWGKLTPRPVIHRMQQDAFRRVVRHAARHQKFFAAQLHERGLDALQIRRPEDLGDILPRRKTSSRTLLRISSAARRKQFLRQPELPDLPSVSI